IFKERKEIMKKLFLMLVLLLTFTVTLFGCDRGADVEGTINVVVLDLEDEEIFKGSIDYQKDDTLLGILQKHETIALKGETSSYGFYITEVKGINASSFTKAYWSILVNGEYSMVGISEIDLVDGMSITLALETY
ncbi:MAG TPA: DUF4430 domain-containing protein, partial [Bacilli bacterium]|nr:DUF4430 domain-containing protein [Bacilli bacterium]